MNTEINSSLIGKELTDRTVSYVSFDDVTDLFTVHFTNGEYDTYTKTQYYDLGMDAETPVIETPVEVVETPVIDETITETTDA